MSLITEEYILPSEGKIYSKQFDPHIKLKSMTVAHEMKRLSPAINQYQKMCEILDDCLVTKLPISTYDMCLADYQYLLQKLRVVTYGPNYSQVAVCPNPLCNNVIKIDINLDEIKPKKFDFKPEHFLIHLPVSDVDVKLKLQTPRDLDIMEAEKKKLLEDFKDAPDPSLLVMLESIIETFDGKKLNKYTDREMLKNLNMRDVNKILNAATALNEKMGMNDAIEVECNQCGLKASTTFRINSTFFRPEDN